MKGQQQVSKVALEPDPAMKVYSFRPESNLQRQTLAGYGIKAATLIFVIGPEWKHR